MKNENDPWCLKPQLSQLLLDQSSKSRTVLKSWEPADFKTVYCYVEDSPTKTRPDMNFNRSKSSRSNCHAMLQAHLLKDYRDKDLVWHRKGILFLFCVQFSTCWRPVSVSDFSYLREVNRVYLFKNFKNLCDVSWTQK